MSRLLLFLFLLLPAYVNGQFSTSLDVPALTTGRVPSRARQPVVTFDKRIHIVAQGQPSGWVCLYINTRTGDMGLMFNRAGLCDLNINDENFQFALYRASGQVENYVTRRTRGVLKHTVMTGHTEINPVRYAEVPRTTLKRQSGVTRGARSGVSGHAYRAASGDGPTIYLYGTTHPPELIAQDFLGFGSIGYLKTNRGVFMSIKAGLGAMDLEARSWSDVTTQLDLHPFENIEIDMDNDVRATLDREESKLRAERYSGGCRSEQEQLRSLKLEDVAARREALLRKNRGNIYQNEASRKAAEDMMMPNIRVMYQELQLQICHANDALSRSRGSSERVSIERSLECYRNNQSILASIRSEWEAIEARHGNDITGSYQQRARIRRELLTMKRCL